LKVKYQRDLTDCGVTCVSFIIEYYAGYVPLEKLREDTNTTVSGTTAYDMIKTLKKYNFDAYGIKIKETELTSITLPCIAHVILPNGCMHFVVIVKRTSKAVFIMNPASGKEKYTLNDFNKIWDKVIILCVPNAIIPNFPKQKGVFSFLLQLIKKEKKLIKIIIGFNLGVILLSFGINFYLKIGYSNILHFNWPKSFYQLTFFFGILLFVRAIWQYGTEKTKLYLSQHVEINCVYSFLDHILKLPISKFQSYLESDILTRLEETRELKQLVIDIILTICLELICSNLVLILLWNISSQLCKYLIMSLIFYFILGFLISRFYYHFVHERIEEEMKWQQNTLENFKLMTTMKHLNAYEWRRAKMEERLCQNISKINNQKKKIIIFQTLKDNYLEFLQFCLCIYSLSLIHEQKLTLIDFFTFQSLYYYFLTPIKHLIEVLPKFYYLKGALYKIGEFMNIEEEKDRNRKKEMSENSIEFQNITFSYCSLPPVLSKVSLYIDNNSHVFLKGSSGSGKSTFCQLLIKEYSYQKGKILIGGNNINDYSINTLRKNIVYLSQKEHLFHGTIYENILFGREVSEERMTNILKICHIEEIVSKKALRYDTTIDEFSISGGEQQRLMLARTLLTEAKIYILDECLSEVEEDQEKEIIKNLKKFLKDKTLLYVSHRNHSNLFQEVIDFDEL